MFFEMSAYWKQQLSGTLPMLDLPTDRPRVPTEGVEGELYRCTLPSRLSRRICMFASSRAVESPVLFLSLLKVLLYRYTGQKEIMVGMPMKGGTGDDQFSADSNIVALRSSGVGTKPFAALLEDVGRTLAAAQCHALYRFEDVLRALEAESNTKVNRPLFQVIFSYEHIEDNNPVLVAGEGEAGQLDQYELIVEVLEQKEAFTMCAKYNPGLFDFSTIERILGQYIHLLEEVLKEPNLLPGDYPILSKKEQQTILHDWNATTINYPKDKCFHELFEEQAQKTPNELAVCYENEFLTYECLDKKSTLLGLYLQAKGIGPNSLVGLCVKRSLDMIVGLLGILKAGGAYVPLGPDYPAERLKYMMQDSEALLVLTQEHLIEGISSWMGNKTQAVALDRDWDMIEKEARAGVEFQREVQPADLAYLMYTSGSTGRPKGVMIPHRALTNFLISMGEQPGLQAKDKLLAVTTYCFDIAGLELYLPLLKGAQCWICSEEKVRDAKKLMQEIRKRKPTIMQATPATWTMLFHAGWKNEEQVKILCGGEALPETLRRDFVAAHCEVWNMYGPTETTIWSTIQYLGGEGPVTIGRPIANTQLYILDQKLRPVPIGVPGELCIAGDGLAKGYWNQPDTTAEKFVTHPFAPETRLYRTGDLARWRSDGTIDFLGRMDHQVKIRGFRIELGEIETQLNQHPAIRESVAVVKEYEDGQHLVAYYVGKESNPVDPQRLREHLRGSLPEYMIPGLFLHLENMPLTPNGKTDRKALMERKVELTRIQTMLPPESELEKQLWVIWKEVLHVENIGIEDGFFEVGGASVSAAVVVERIKQAFDCEMTVATLFAHTTIKKLSQYILKEKIGYDVTGAIKKKAVHGRESTGIDAPSIAIVGMAGKFPLAGDLDAFWRNIEEGRNCITEIPEARWNWKTHYGDPAKERGKTKVKWGGFIEGVGVFDPLFFGIAPREAELMDPQQRLLMTYTWLALEDAGIAPRTLSEQATGVFIAAAPGEYRDFVSMDPEDHVYRITSEMTSMIPSRISYTLNLHGPSELCETTCSSSLVAVHRAIQSILGGECEQAIVGGVNLLLSPKGFSCYEAMGLLSSQKDVKSFQSEANGYVRAEGVGVVVLKPLPKALEDGDVIYAQVKGSGVSHGGKGMSLTSPNGAGMKAAMIHAYDAAGIDPRTVAYIEAHGIASPIGDCIEIEALKSGYEEVAEAHQTDAKKKAVCHLSCLKPIMGHGEVVSGMAALIKVVSALRHQVIPGLPRLSKLHEDLSLSGTPFTITQDNQPWTAWRDENGNTLPRRASINSYGFGASAHVVLEEYLPTQKDSVQEGQAHPSALPKASEAVPEIVILSAKTQDRLEAMAAKMQTFIEMHPKTSLSDLAYTLQVGREAMRERLAIVTSTLEELALGLKRFASLFSDTTLSSNTKGPTVITGTVSDGLNNERLKNELERALAAGDFEAIARAWVEGAEVPWASRKRDSMPRKIALPTYPFEEKTYWASKGNKSVFEEKEQIKKKTGEQKRICVVGAGPAGLVMAKSLLEEGHEPVIYETEDTLGGIWNLRKDKKAGVYKNTRFQNAADTSFFSDFPPNTEQGLFLGVEQVRDYLEAYAETFDLKRFIHYGSKVDAVLEKGERWRVEVVQGARREIAYFDGVALCHGRYRTPFFPIIDGLYDFQGEVLHAGQYYDNRIFEGKRVLVIGNGVSGMDIAEEASHVAQEVFWSMRSLKFVLPRMVGYLPNDFISPANLLISKDNSMIMERLKDSMPAYYALYQKSGLFPSVEDFRSYPFVHINDGVIQRVAEGAIQAFVEEVERFTESGCVFKRSGKKIEDLDMVVLCTGYDNTKSFDYVKEFSMQDDFSMGLFYHKNPSMVNTYGLQDVGTTGTFPYLEMVARWYAQIISGHYELSREELDHRIDVRDIVVAPLSNVIMGLKLGLLPKPEKEFSAFWRCLNYPSFPAMYRLRGPHSDPQAQKTFSRSIQRSLIQQDSQDPALKKVKYRLLAGLGDEVVQDLLEREEITREDHEQALRYRNDPLVLTWDTQCIKPLRGGQTANQGQTNIKTRAIDTSLISEEAFLDGVKNLMSQTLKLESEQIGLERNLSDYGFSSVTLTAFSQKIMDVYHFRLDPSVFMEHVTLKALSGFLYKKFADQEGKRLEKTSHLIEEKSILKPTLDTEDIAIIGLGGKLPGAQNLAEFWRNLLENQSPVSTIPKDRWSWEAYYGDPGEENKTDCHHGAFIEDVGHFDPLHFKLSPREATLLDPQQRLLLEVAWETLENAGYAKKALYEKKVGCFIGVERQDYAEKIRALGHPIDGYLNTGNSHAMLVNRISHFFGWKGPALAIDTACSSSFTALHTALRSIQHGEADLALAGGVNLVLAPGVFICNRKLGLFTGEDHVKPFDRAASGHFFGDAVGLVLLKRLAAAVRDGDHVYGVIKGMSVRHGGQGVIMTVPNAISHREVIEEALHQAGLEPGDIDYIEGQGTGNDLTDKVELKAYHQVFSKHPKPMPIGSIKGHMGHFAGASGVIALIKSLLSFKNNRLIKVANFKELNWDRDDEPFSCKVLDENRAWPPKWVQDKRIPRRIGIHNFGFGGVTGHMILEEYLASVGRRPQVNEREHLIVLSTRKADQMIPMAERLLRYLQTKEYTYYGLDEVELRDMAYTLQVGREPMEHRMAFLGKDLPQLMKKLEHFIEGVDDLEGYWRGESKENVSSLAKELIKQASMKALAGYWVQGMVIDWELLYGAARPRRIVLPTFPFSRVRYWVGSPNPGILKQVSLKKAENVNMPEEVKGMIPTLNGTGTMTKQLLSYSESFAEYAGQCKGEVLDVGCAYGAAALSALERGARVLAVDMEPQHLEILKSQVKEEAKSRISTQQGVLPALDFGENRFAAIHAGRVLHFLRPRELQTTIKKMYQWLQPGGKLFLTCDTPYFPHWAARVSEYEQRKEAGDLWPGYIEHLESFFANRAGSGATDAWDSGKHAAAALEGVEAINLLDPDILQRECTAVGLEVENVGFESLAVEVKGVRAKGGVEHVGMIAIKPHAKNVIAGEQSEGPHIAPDMAKSEYSVWGQPEAILKNIKKMLAEELDLEKEEIREEVKFFDLGLNSSIGVLWVSRINEEYGLSIPAVKLFSYPTLQEFYDYMLSEGRKQGLFKKPTKAEIPMPNRELPRKEQSENGQRSLLVASSRMAVVGVSGRFPQSRNKLEFWDAVKNKKDCIGEVAKDRWNMNDYFDENPETPGKTDCKWMGVLEDADRFDPMFFNISPLEARHMDPQQRLFLEEAWSCLEDAGYAPEALSGSRCGVFVGYGNYGQNQMGSTINAQRFLGASPSILAARISYFLNLQGPCLTLDTACSASLVAVAEACNSLLLGDSDMALAGGVSAITGPAIHIMASKAGMLSKEGRCFTFDQRANGFVPGEGVGVVALKRLSDAQRDSDIIYGVIQGWGVNQDGRTNGITAPNEDAQVRLEKEVYDKYGIDPAQIQYVEMHGTGTKLGDPIEVDALIRSFQSYTDKKGYCALGSVKSNIGHTLAAAGIAGLIKMLMALKYRQLPPTSHVEQLNEHIVLDHSPFYINTECRDWEITEGEKRRAAVSSFGYSGTNAHVVLEGYEQEYDEFEAMNSEWGKGPFLIVLSAKNEERLKVMARQLHDFIIDHSPLTIADLAYTLQVGRVAMEERLGMIVGSMKELLEKLSAFLEGRRDVEDLYQGQSKNHQEILELFAGDEDMEKTTEVWMHKRKYSKLLSLWVLGLNIDWNKLYRDPSARGELLKPHRISLPTYPFARERYWEASDLGALMNSEYRTGHVEGRKWHQPVDEKTKDQSYQTIEYQADGRSVRYLQKQWEPLPPAPGKELEQNIAILATAETKSLALLLLREFPESVILYPDDITSLLQQPEAAAVAYKGCIDLIGCGNKRHESLDWVEWLRRLIAEKNQEEVMLLSVTQGLEAYGNYSINMSGASRVGLYRMLQSEYSSLQSRHMDADPTISGGALVKQIVGEFLTRDEAPEVCYRKGKRYRAVLIEEKREGEKREEKETAKRIIFSEKEVLWITGGTRGLGFLCAQHFVEHYGVKRLLLSGQEALPPRNEWSSLTDRNDPCAKKIAAIAALEKQGVEIQVLSVSLTDGAAVRESLEAVKKSMGPIGGVIHCAGIMDMETPAFIRKSVKGFRQVLEPKWAGLDVLLSLVHKEPLRCVILFSSVAGIIPSLGAGQSDYAMANAYMDYVAQAQVQGCPIVSIQWPHWGESEKGEMKSAAYAHTGLLSHTHQEGLRLIDHVLSSDMGPVVLPAVVNPELWKPQQLMKRKITEAASHESYSQPADKVNPSNMSEPALFSETVQDWLMELFCRELEIPLGRIQADTAFQHYGVDSILLAQLSRTLSKALAQPLDPSIIFEYSTLEALASWLISTHASSLTQVLTQRNGISGASHIVPSSPSPRKATRFESSSTKRETEIGASTDIAVVGMSCCFPGANGIEAYWRLLSEGRNAITVVPPERWENKFSFCAGLIDTITHFDPSFFLLPEEDARVMDPQALLVLEESLKLFYHAGYSMEEMQGTATGVYLGARSRSNPAQAELLQAQNPIVVLGQNYLAANICHFFDLKGPGLVVDTACSSALVAMHLAIESLRNGEIESALVGGVSLLTDDLSHRTFQQRNLLSREPFFHVFDQRASGVVLGEGAGLVLLKTLEQAVKDEDRIYAVIKALAINNDGRTAGPATPNIQAQKAVMRTALAKSGKAPGDISFIEANGSGSEVTDLLELKAMESIYRSSDKSPCGVGSIKPNIGHPLCAEGIASFIKLVLMLDNKQHVPFLSGNHAMTHYPMDASPFFFYRKNKPWSTTPRIAALNCFADGGTNAHLIVEGWDASGSQSVRRQPVPPPLLHRRDLRGNRIVPKKNGLNGNWWGKAFSRPEGALKT